MKRLGIVILLLAGLSACAQSEQKSQVMNWDQVGGQTQVAKVSHIKSLISPGFY